MQIFSLFLLVVSAGALPQLQPLTLSEALEPRLEERGGDAWIGSFPNSTCKGRHIGEWSDRPKLTSNNCIPFTAKGPYINVYWGTSDDTDDVTFYSAIENGKCQKKDKISNYEQPSNQIHTCIDVATYFNGAVIAGVTGY